MSERARALEQAAQYRAIALDAIAAWQGQDDRADDKHRRGVSARTRAELRSRMLAVDAVLLAVDPPPSGAGPQAEELRAANVANLREMVGMAGRHRETLLAVRECILALARAAEATQHRQDRRRWAESLKEQHQRHVIESDALRKVLAAWEITANERSARLAAVEAERDRLQRVNECVYEVCGCGNMADAHCMICCRPLTEHRLIPTRELEEIQRRFALYAEDLAERDREHQIREQAWCDTHRVLHNQQSHPTHWTPLPGAPLKVEREP